MNNNKKGMDKKHFIFIIFLFTVITGGLAIALYFGIKTAQSIL